MGEKPGVKIEMSEGNKNALTKNALTLAIQRGLVGPRNTRAVLTAYPNIQAIGPSIKGLAAQNRAANVLSRVAQSGMLNGRSTGAVLEALPPLSLNTQFMGAVKGVRGPGGRTRVMYAAFTGNMEKLRELVNGANVNEADITGQTPLIFAAFEEHMDAVRFLVEKGANVNAQTTQAGGNTPLHMAIYKNNIDIARFLCDNGANVNIGAERYSPLHLASGYAYVDPEMVQMLCEHGADVNASGLQGTPLHMVNRGPTGAEKVELLCTFGADIEARTTQMYYIGHTPLLMACEHKDNVDVIRVLCERGADVNVTSSTSSTNGMTPLILACRNKSSDGSVTVLCESGSDKELVVAGKTPLIYAIDRTTTTVEPSEGVVRELLEQGANPSGPAFNGQTPLGFAVIQENIPAITAICQFAKTRGVDVGIEAAKKSVTQRLVDNQRIIGRIEMKGTYGYGNEEYRKLVVSNENLNKIIRILNSPPSEPSATPSAAPSSAAPSLSSFPRGGSQPRKEHRKSRKNLNSRKSRKTRKSRKSRKTKNY